jgi:hypothetical protein
LACGIFTRLRYSTEDDVNDNISFGIQDVAKKGNDPMPRITDRLAQA